MGICGKVCEIYRNISFCRKVGGKCAECSHFKKLCATGDFCPFKGNCPEQPEVSKMRKTYERMENNGKAD